MSREFQKATSTFKPPARAKRTPNRTIRPSPSPPEEDFKEVLLLMSLRANQVYRHSHWSQVSFKHHIDLKARHTFPKEVSLCRTNSFFYLNLDQVLITFVYSAFLSVTVTQRETKSIKPFTCVPDVTEYICCGDSLVYDIYKLVVYDFLFLPGDL